MIPGWENICFFAFAGSVLVLLLLYWLKFRGKTFFTQALFLWEENLPEEKSSSRFLVRTLPLSFWLEAAALILLVCGGAGFFTVTSEDLPPAVILLNNSCSMTPETRARGLKAVKEHLKKFPDRRVIWTLCGTEPEVLSRKGTAFDPGEKWNAFDRECDISKALSWAKENFPGAEISLVTDRVPDKWIPGEISLFCCGTPGENIAIANAGINENRILLEVCSFADRTKEVVLKVNSRIFQKFTIGANGRKLFNFTFDTSAEVLTFSIESQGDLLEYDNTVILVNPRKKPVTYSFGTLAEREKKALEQVLSGNPDFSAVAGNCELLFTRYSGKIEKFSGHRFFLHRDEKSVFDGLPPFFNAQEPLLKGLSGTSLVWAFFPGVQLPGRGVIFSSAGALFSVEPKAGRKYDLHLNLKFENSNLTSQPFWPGFFCNLAEFLRRSRPGVTEHNVKNGELICVNLSSGSEKLTWRTAGLAGEPGVAEGKSVFQLKKCGLYTLDDGTVKTLVAVNPCVSELSDLRNNKSMFIPRKTVLPGEKRPDGKSWIFIAGALLLLLLDQTLLSRRKK